MGRWFGKVATIALLGGGNINAMGFFALSAQAQAPAFPDVPANHWAYEAVQSLADKGLIKGYSGGTFSGGRALTRYEFATVIARLLETITPLPAATPPAPPPGVTQDDLNKLQVLIETFRPELAAIQTDLDAAKKNIETLRSQLGTVQKSAQKAQDTADASYGSGPGRRLSIGGFIQFRYDRVDSSNRALFPDGIGEANGYNGSYFGGTNGESFKIREARLFFTGAITPNTRYLAEFGTPGATNFTANGTAQTFVRRLYGQYTFGDGSARNPTLTVGQFWVPFGYILNSLRPTWYTPERPFSFNESAAGLFAGQEFDRGIQFRYAPVAAHLYSATVALINGSGATSNDTNRQKDVVGRLTYAPGKDLSVGASAYYGRFDTLGNTSANAVKNFYGADIEYTPSRSGPFLQAEYLRGKYETVAPATVGSPAVSPPTGVPAASAYLPGNNIQGYYVTSGWTFHPKSARPLSLVGSYDYFDRSSIQKTRRDKNVVYGAQYNLDRATRVRLFYTHPLEVSYAPGTPKPARIGLYTAEMLVRF